MPNVYEHCPKFESGEFLLRLVDKSDTENLLAFF